MATLLEWFAQYSLGVVVLLILGALVLYVGRGFLDRAIGERVELAFKEHGLRLERRSAFENRVLTDRYEALNDLMSRLVAISTDVNRVRTGHEPHHDDFVVGKELVPLTVVFEDIERKRLLLGEELHTALRAAVSSLLSLHNSPDDVAFQRNVEELVKRFADLRELGEKQFGLARIRW